MQYRRAYINGSSYFFTVVTEGRQKLFVNEMNVDILRQAFSHVMNKRPFVIDAAVILPDHIHCIWTLPPDDANFSIRWRLIKSRFTKHCDNKYKIKPNLSRIRKNEQAIWQHRYWEHLLHDELDFENHVNYIHYNPVKHGYVNKASNWKFSSIHRYIKQGVIPDNWGSLGVSFSDEIGNE